jgi:hypothetical protein
MLNLKVSVVVLLLAMCGLTTAADKPPAKSIKLDLQGEKVQRHEYSQSQIGFTSTKVFYMLHDHRIVVAVIIDNAKKGFPVEAKVYEFAKEVTPADLAKWLNNQHSDGLFPDVPEPKATIKLPAEACGSLQGKLLGQKAVNNTTYNQYQVEIKFNTVQVNESIKLQEFKDTANVYVPTP